MASTLHVILSDDLETALAKFVPQGPIDSRATLEAAIFDLLDALQSANADVASLIGAIAYKASGLLEVVIASRNEAAFTFRGRVLKALQKSSHYPNPIFITCTERIGAFLISLPPWIPLDQSIMTKFHAFSENLASTDTTESEYFVNKKAEPEPVEQVPIKPSKTLQLGKRHQRASSVSSTIQDTGRYPTKSRRASTGVLKQPPSPTVATNRPGAGPALTEQLRECLEAYFAACLEDGVEDYADTNLFQLLVAPAITLQPQEPLNETSLEFSLPLPGRDLAQLSSSQPTVPLHAIIRYLGDATKPKLGEWPVVVSQRGIKHVRKYVSRDKETFSRIETTIRQLAMGMFSSSNRAKLMDHHHGVPIYAAEVGRSLRLLYHIDFGAPTNSTLESQFIRIFGVFSTTEIDLNFWMAVSAQLGRRGPEYIRRCKDQGGQVLSRRSGGIVSPQLFSPLEVSQWSGSGADVEIDDSHRLELHRILSLEKFVPLSHTFFEAIQRFTETSFMFSVSGHENRIINHPSSCLVLGRSGTGKTTCMLFRIIGLDVAAKKSTPSHTLRQVFVTQSRTLARRVRLDCLQFRQTEMETADPSTQKPVLGLSLLDMDESAEEEGVLPPKFSDLEDSHFPLFLTYDQLCKLLEADFDLQFQPSSLPSPKNARARAKQSSVRQPLVDFDYFDCKVWPHFNQQLKKGLHPALVYSEFMGIIKGSEAALSKSSRYLGRTEYEKQSNRSLLGDNDDRSKIYTLFEAYQKLRPSAAYDVADRVHALMNSLQENGVPGKPIDFLYVDEAQDNLIIDAALLRTLCPNPHGLFFAGDTAQTISVGSAFKFSELKAFLYRLERNDASVRGGGRLPVDPNFFQLSTNYRSHSGIVNAAAFIVKLLDAYFKHSIDSLAPEIAHVDVDIHKPEFFSGMSDPADFKTLISEPATGTIGLGARQVIIVRHESAANDLRAAIGRVAVVLTLYESKGMEFNDVLLFNFFTDSPATATDWRAMFLAQSEGRMFDDRRHSILQSELKKLYVGLTRARERVWIWEESSNGRIMEDLLTGSSPSLATTYRGGFIPQIAVINHEEEWAEQGQQYFAKNLFSEAAFCFQRAGMPWWMAVAQTYKDRQEAMRLAEKEPSRSSKFHKVAQSFDRLAEEGQSKEDQESLRLLFSNAGECYTVVPDHFSAAVAFLNARKYTVAAYQYRMAGCFDEAVDIVKRYPVDPEVAENIKYAAKVSYTKGKDTASLHKASELCDSKDEFVDFLVDHGFGDQRIDFLDSIEEHEKIAQVLWDDGDYVNAVLRFRESNDSSSPRQGSQCLLEGIRSSVPLVTSYENESDVLSELFKLSRTSMLTPDEKAEIRFLRAVVNLEGAELKRYGERCLDKQDLPGALLALDAWTQSAALEGVRSTQDNEVAEVLLLCQKFGAVINTIVRTTGFVDLPGMQHIFGVSNTSSKEPARQAQPQDITLQRTIRTCSFIHNVAWRVADREEQARNRADPVTLPTNKVDDMIRRALLRRLNNVVERVDELARRSRAFEICQQFLMYQQCGGRDEGSCWKDHVLEKDLTTERFNSRFRLHILVIAVLNNFTAGTSDEKTRSTKQKLWITKLFQLCYPPINKAGCLSDITPAMIPEYSSTMPIVQSWLHEVFRSLRPGDNVRYFLTNMLITSLLATAFDYGEAVTYLWRGQWSLDPEYAFQNGLIQVNTKPAAGSAIVWLAKGVKTRINLGIYFLNHVLDSEVYLDAEVLVAFAEEVCAQLILNHYAHNYTGYDYMAMPRSWIIRAFARAQSLQVNGAMPWALAATLDNLLNILLLNRKTGKLQMRGSLLGQASLAIRSQAVQRVCHCLTLIGQNITGVRAAVLAVFQKLGVGLLLRPEIQRFARATDWDEAIDALVESMRMSTMDELLIIRHDVGYPSLRAPFKPVVCPDEKNLLFRLRLAQNPPAIALQSDVLCPATNQIAPAQRRGGSTNKSAQKKPEVEAPQLESVASTPEDRRSASIIQAFFRRHRRRAGGPIAAAFERLAKKLKEHTPGSRLERSLLLCLRGPMPHVLAYIRTLKKLSEDTIQTLNRDIQESSHKGIEQLHVKGVEVRRIRNATIGLIRELQPSSKFYFNRRLATPVSTVAIVEKVGQIPELLCELREFVECPEDLDYALGVEPILSNRGPWALENRASPVNPRPLLS